MSNNELNKNEELVDIQDVFIDTSLPSLERLQKFNKQIKNLYHFKCGDIIVSLSYSDNEKLLSELLTRYFINNKT